MLTKIYTFFTLSLMKKKYFILLYYLVALCVLNTTELVHRTYDFTNELDNEKLSLKNYQGRFPARLVNGYLELTRGGVTNNQNNAVIFPDILNETSETEHFTFNLYITRGAEGAGLALVNTFYVLDDSLSYKAESWESPNFNGSFGLGIDVYNPQTSHWFDKWGNFYGREEREISLHWDNKEIYKMMSPVEFRSDIMGTEVNKFDLTINYVTAGALVSLAIQDTLIVDKYFIPEMKQYKKQPVFGASTGDLTSTVILESFGWSVDGEAPEYEIIESVYLLKDAVFHSQSQNITENVQFPENTYNADKVIITLDLTGPEGGVSDWDVGASIFLTDEHGTRYELLRYITPYRRAYVWKVDITHFLPLFIGDKEITGYISTWEPVMDDPAEQKGWKVTAKIDFYKGFSQYKPFKVENLWSGNYEYGNPEEPMIDILEDFIIDIPVETKSAVLRIVTSGHGMSPNYENAAEFRPSERWVNINGNIYYNLLWRTDNYLNPCRPQDGTWKFDRAGWAPGDIVHAWEICLNKYINDGELNVTYQPDDYINHNRGETWEPFHKIEAQIIFFR